MTNPVNPNNAAFAALTSLRTSQNTPEPATRPVQTGDRAADASQTRPPAPPSDIVNAPVDPVDSGVASSVDTDIGRDAVVALAQQVRQQLGGQSLSIANQQPNNLLSLFR